VNDRTNRLGYHYLYWTVSNPATPVVYHQGQWYALRHSKSTGKPYHDRQRVEVYPWTEVPEPQHTETSDDLPDIINLQIRDTPATIDPSGPGSPHRPRSIEQRASNQFDKFSVTPYRKPMATQTMEASIETARRAFVSEGASNAPDTAPHPDPTHI
jgi:hypothetical protein